MSGKQVGFRGGHRGGHRGVATQHDVSVLSKKFDDLEKKMDRKLGALGAASAGQAIMMADLHAHLMKNGGRHLTPAEFAAHMMEHRDDAIEGTRQLVASVCALPRRQLRLAGEQKPASGALEAAKALEGASEVASEEKKNS